MAAHASGIDATALLRSKTICFRQMSHACPLLLGHVWLPGGEQDLSRRFDLEARSRQDLTGSTNAPEAAATVGRILANHFPQLPCDVAAHLATFSFERLNSPILETRVEIKQSWMAQVDGLMKTEVLCWYKDHPKLKRASFRRIPQKGCRRRTGNDWYFIGRVFGVLGAKNPT